MAVLRDVPPIHERRWAEEVSRNAGSGTTMGAVGIAIGARYWLDG